MGDWKAIVEAVAPTLAAALGGPLAGLAARAVSQALLGHENAAEGDLAAAVSGATGDQLVRLREADIAFQTRMQELGVDLERIAAADRDSARQREVNARDNWTPRLLAALIVSGFLGTTWAVLSGSVSLADPAAVGIIGAVIGYVSAKADQVVSYYFGSSAGSARKTEAMANIVEQGKK